MDRYRVGKPRTIIDSVKDGVQGKGSCVGHGAAESDDQGGGHGTATGAVPSVDNATYIINLKIELVIFSGYHSDWLTLNTLRGEPRNAEAWR